MSIPFTKHDEASFLNSESQWKSRLGPGWVGTKILGSGSYGIAGLWEYKGPPSTAPSITQVVVKMSEAALPSFPEPQVFPQSKIDEGVTLRRLAACNSKHIVRIYGGNRLGDRFSEIGDVVRIFLEYCPSGDLVRFLSGYEREPLAPLAEVDVWALFHCMALGIAVVARGTEDLNEPKWGGAKKSVELVHFDLKPDNIFLGRRDGEHTRMPIAKIGDFGEAYEVMKPKYQDDEYGSFLSGRGMSYYNPPEETLQDPYHPFTKRRIPCPHPVKGTCSNIWQLGTIVNQLLLRTQLRFDDHPAADQCTPTSFNPDVQNLTQYPNHSLNLETEEVKRLYSKTLLTLVMECLLRPPLLRPKTEELVTRTREGYRVTVREGNGRKGKLLPVPPDMRNVPFVEGKDPKPPIEWDVDDTTEDYLERAFALTQDARVYSRGDGGDGGSGSGRPWSRSSGGGSFLASIFSGRGRTRGSSLTSSPGSRASAGSGIFGNAVGWWVVGTGGPNQIAEGGEKEAREKTGDFEIADDWEELYFPPMNSSSRGGAWNGTRSRPRSDAKRRGSGNGNGNGNTSSEVRVGKTGVRGANSRVVKSRSPDRKGRFWGMGW